jgi:hypothetical protein
MIKNYEVTTWNPILIALASKNLELVKYLLASFPNIHCLNCLSKPYSKPR